MLVRGDGYDVGSDENGGLMRAPKWLSQDGNRLSTLELEKSFVAGVSLYGPCGGGV